MIVINAVGFSRFLRSTKDFSAALGAANRYNNPDSDVESRDGAEDPKRTKLDDTVRKLDVMDLLLMRRKLHADEAQNNIVAINLYSDASPVSGSELQGMLMDIHRRDASHHERVELPGCTLSYGQFDAISKTVCLLHSLWLVAGPDAKTIRYCLRKVASVCTDFGTEVHTLEMRDVVDAYCAYMEGAPLEHCRTLVDVNKRWLPWALRVSGWSHTFGNIMRHTAESTTRWPRVLNQMRALVGFFRNTTWREFVQKAMEENPPADFDLHTLDRFSAQIAKWRYETVPATMAALLPLRVLCQKYLRQEWFQNAQDRQSLKAVFDACGDEFLWKFMEHSYREVFAPTERDRHFGMICNCTEHLRQRREDRVKHIPCWRNGRRLGEAAQYVKDTAAARLARSRQITAEECENDQEVWRVVSFFLKRCHAEVLQRMKYFDLPPWCAVKCDTVEGAKYFLEQVSRYPIEHHDPVTRSIIADVGDDIQTRASGGEVTAELQALVDFFKTVNLNESCGEGWHRGSQYEKKRAYASTVSSLKRAVRRKGVFFRLKQFRRLYGKRGVEVLRFEFRNWKRILSKKRSKWRCKRMTDTEAFEQIYREGKASEVNWSSIVTRMDLHHVETDKATSSEAARNEYLRAQVQPGTSYGIEVPPPRAADSHAAPQSTVAPSVHFRLLASAHGHSRAHTMPTVEDQEDVSKTAPLAWHVQFHQRRDPCEGEPAVPEGVVEVFDDGEPQWVRPCSMCSFDQMQTSLMEFRTEQDSPVQGCTWLSDPHLARPHMALTDKDCPVITLIQQLKRAGWIVSESAVVHANTRVGLFDGAEATRFRGYYQCLLNLPKVLTLTKELPSRAPMAYYTLLLRGIPAMPYQSAHYYQCIVNTELRKKGKIAELLPLPDVPAIPVVADDAILVAQPEVPEGERHQQKTSAHAPSMPRKGQGKKRPAPGESSGSGGPGPSTPPPPIEDPPGGGAVDPPPPPGPPDVPGEESDEDAINVGPVVAEPEPKQRRKLGRVYQDGLLGVQISYKEFVNITSGKMYKNYIMKCPTCGGGCHKTCGRIPSNMRNHGELEPLAFLHAWAFMTVSDGTKHSVDNPDQASVDEFLAQNEEGLMDLFRSLVPSP